MVLRKFALVAFAVGALFWSKGYAQDSGPLIEALIRKGILTNQEAEELRADILKERKQIPLGITPGGKSTTRLSLSMRIQAQYANFDTDITGTTIGPVATQHVFLRRMYFTLRAGLGGNWAAVMTYDFAATAFDDATIEWKPSSELTFNFGLRKVNTAYEERYTSANLKAIERSGVTRYFVASNNGRRMGAASYRLGVHLEGRKELNAEQTFVYGAAVTNPERNETLPLAAGTGDGTNNKPAFWGNMGLRHKLPNAGLAMYGVTAGYLPDQGGNSPAALGRGFDLSLYTIYADVSYGRFAFMGEFLEAQVERGASATRDASPRGFFLQPSYLLTKTFEAVARYQSLDSDGRGINMSDVVRSSPNGGLMNQFSSWYLGGNWYLRGNDLKFQIGGEYGKTEQTVTGAPAEAKVMGVRSQMQVIF